MSPSSPAPANSAPKSTWRRDVLTRPIFAWAKKAMPAMSDTEREALEAGDV